MTAATAKKILRGRLSVFETKEIDWENAVKNSSGLSQGELSRAADEAAKRVVLGDRTVITNEDLSASIAERKSSSHH